MFVKDVIILACKFTENNELALALENESELTSENEALKEKLLKNFNLVRSEIACEYIPSLKKQSFLSGYGKIYFSSFENNPVKIVSVRGEDSRRKAFDTFEDRIEVEKGKIDVVYYADSQDLTFEQEFESNLPERVYAYGVAKEFYLLEALYEEAEIWNERFMGSLAIFARKRSETILPRRRWI